jgi:succinoglycan biosynthesis protein ExoV
MKIEYFQHQQGNFGDELNPYLWNKLFPNLIKQTDDLHFYGIGTILDQRISQQGKAIIFGSGIRKLEFSFNNYRNLDIRFVRGPISANILSKFDAKYIADPAYFLPIAYPSKPLEKKYKVSFMPHYASMKIFPNLEQICRKYEINFISPFAPIEEVTEAIGSSSYVYAEAMHGAITADALRIPWRRVMLASYLHETSIVSELKWNDWMQSVGVKNIPLKIELLTAPSNSTAKFLFDKIITQTLLNRGFKMIGNNPNSCTQLSENKTFENILEKLNEEKIKLINDYER